jgi:hypothetical protein
MALVIDNLAVEEKIQTVASLTGESIPAVIEAAMDDRIAQLKPKGTMRRDPTVEEVMAMIDSYKLERIPNAPTEDEILGYGPNGYCE